MTKAEAVDQVYLAINGGKLSGESSVERPDISNYLGAAVSYVQAEAAKERLQINLKIGSPFFANMQLDEDIYCVYEVETKMDEVRDEVYVTLPKKLANLPGNAGLRYVAPKAGNKPFIPTTRFAFSGKEHLMGDNSFHYFEKSDGEDRVYIKNFSNMSCAILVSMAVKVSDLDDDDELPVSLGYEKLVIDLCVEFFKYQRGLPEDNKIDGVDAV